MIGQDKIEPVPLSLLHAFVAESARRPAPAASPQFPSNANNQTQYTSRLLVEQWLTDFGISFRVKDQLDGKGRRVYVLKQCPFNPAHSDPDACIMQGPDGKMSAQCFHNSCKGRGWQEFKGAIGIPGHQHYEPPLASKKPRKRSPVKVECPPPDPAVTIQPDEHPGAPERFTEIQGNKRQLRDVTEDAMQALLAKNDPPTLFQRGGLLTRLRVRTDNGVPFLEPLRDAALRGVLARVANWTKSRESGESIIIEDDSPPMDVVKDLASLPAWPGIPVIHTIVEVPVLTPTGELITVPGFHAEARLWYHQAPGLALPDIPPVPSRVDIDQAKKLLITDLLGDFPFADEASKAHALAALLLHFVRLLIDGPTPLHLLDAPVEGTGKTLLAIVIAIVATGLEPAAIAEGTCDEEWRKRITAVLIEGPAFVLLDNLNRLLDSGALAAVLTSRTWKDRILGFSKTATLPNTCVWMASGNNTQLSRELIRRTVWCRLDAKVDAPWERASFRHPHLIQWVKANRGRLIAAVLTLCNAWVAAGRPAGAQTLGMFENWAEVVGGILDVAGVPGLLTNAKQFRATHADKSSEWRAFVVAWWQEYADRAVGVTELFKLVQQQALLDSVVGDKGEKSQRTRLGIALAKAADRVFGEYRIERAGEDHKGRQQYRLHERGVVQEAKFQVDLQSLDR